MTAGWWLLALVVFVIGVVLGSCVSGAGRRDVNHTDAGGHVRVVEGDER